jgi:hypothetical protein
MDQERTRRTPEQDSCWQSRTGRDLLNVVDKCGFCAQAPLPSLARWKGRSPGHGEAWRARPSGKAGPRSGKKKPDKGLDEAPLRMELLVTRTPGLSRREGSMTTAGTVGVDVRGSLQQKADRGSMKGGPANSRRVISATLGSPPQGCRNTYRKVPLPCGQVRLPVRRHVGARLRFLNEADEYRRTAPATIPRLSSEAAEVGRVPQEDHR